MSCTFPGLRFSMLGQLQVWRGLTETTISQPQRRAVLAVLLLRRDSLVSVEELIDAIWGAHPPPSARTVLHTHIHHLRRTLRNINAGSEAIRRVGGQYRLELPSCPVDVDSFRRLASFSAVRRAEGQYERALRDMRAALGLWRGHALEDVPGPWAGRHRAALTAEYLTATAARLSLELRLGTSGDHVSELRTLVLEHPLDERFRELLMLAQHQAGLDRQALDTYRQAQRYLAAELGIDPGPSLRRMRQRIRAAASVRSRTTTPTASLPVPRQLPAVQPYFHGRERELDAAEDSVRTASTNTPVIAVLGPPGIGKTSFVTALAHRLSAGYPDGQLFAQVHGSVTPRAEGRVMRALDSLLSALGVSVHASTGGVQARAAQLRGVLSSRRLILVVDDVRDADEARAFLPGIGSCVVLVTARGDLASLAVREGAARLPLRPLTQADACAFLRHRIGHRRTAAEPEAVSLLAGMCHGVPAQLARVAAYAVVHPDLTLTEMLRDAVPALLQPRVVDDVSTWSPGASLTTGPGHFRYFRRDFDAAHTGQSEAS
ncbi:BTAD domain-containing putative transcriptional regulator [Streptomyces sp. NPDC017943]|uniref:AfsR/SARP family transcriptional regulator n=1 Tax=Streptomyces sp. NPDC017943 TaxID=3365019 RepID=UPI0037B885ED